MVPKHHQVFGLKTEVVQVLLRIFTLFVMLFYAVEASADAVVVKADEIKELLTGNTAIGNWNGTEYRQYFHANGTTIYSTRNSRSSLGKWRVDATNGTYQSLWNEGKWDSYTILRDGEDLLWLDAGQVTYSFRVLSGQQLVWSQQ